jgi:hypothetical protein
MTVTIYRLYDPRYPDITRYIGKTFQKDIRSRLNQHICHSKYYKRHSCNWIKSLLRDNVRPKLEVLDNCDISEWENREKFYIDKYKTDKLTNIEPGGNSTTIREYCKIGTSKNTKEVIQMDLDYNIINNFKSCAEASRTMNINKSLIASACRKNGIISHGFRWKWKNNPNKCNPIDKRFTPVLQYDLDNNFLKEYNSVKEASMETGIHPASITNCTHDITSRAGNYYWKIKDPSFIKHR